MVQDRVTSEKNKIIILSDLMAPRKSFLGKNKHFSSKMSPGDNLRVENKSIFHAIHFPCSF